MVGSFYNLKKISCCFSSELFSKLRNL